MRNKNFWLKIGLAIVVLVCLKVAVNKFLNFDYDQWLGYLDHQTYWQGLYSFAQGQVNFRDFIYEYGIFYLLVGLPLFVIMGKTFYASTLLMYVILPIITLVLSFLIGRQLLSTGPLALFLLLLLMYEVNSFYPAARHIVPEFGLIMLLVGLEKNNNLKTILGSFFLAFSFTLTINENTKKDEDIFVYPLGPYYQLTGKKSAVTIMSPWHYEIAPFLVDLTVNQLQEKKPKLVIINAYNAWSIKSSLNNVTYNVHSEGKNIIFEGLTTAVEDYLAENYEIAKKFEVAWILTKGRYPDQCRLCKTANQCFFRDKQNVFQVYYRNLRCLRRRQNFSSESPVGNIRLAGYLLLSDSN
ncbi:MAG: hypothetical protein FJ044_02530 [Candidatus Cloacimonetes bacterium]|nr:hypothetical protein [Candidatus Cloacimonadota bacterium]